MITLYTIECGVADILKKKLTQKGIEFEVVDDIEIFRQLKIDDVPVLKVENQLLGFTQAIEWVNNV